MVIVDTESLAGTLDSVGDALFFGQAVPERERKAIGRWIAERQGKPGSYAGMFAPTSADLASGIKVFSGEMVRSRAGVSHILGQEACRTLILLGVEDTTVKQALDPATHGMLQRLRQTEGAGPVHGMYCCGICSVAYWRHVMVGGLDRCEERLAAGMSVLKAHRIGDRRWRRFPLYYTLLALSELDLAPALDEMRRMAPLLERYVRRVGCSKFSQRRRVIAERVLARC